LGGYFTFLQLFEYRQANFTIADSTYGATFFIATGFHGLHVIIGSIFILISWKRLNSLILHSNHIVGFETAA
jgi:heme/copper-type cytochrome/quinol oxidase subunit 3